MHPPEWDVTATPSKASIRMALSVRRREVIKTILELDKGWQRETCADDCFEKYEPMSDGSEPKKRDEAWIQTGDDDGQSRWGERGYQFDDRDDDYAADSSLCDFPGLV
jgi:hypothetical protein